jgi:hypothetical protein
MTKKFYLCQILAAKARPHAEHSFPFRTGFWIADFAGQRTSSETPRVAGKGQRKRIG